MTIGERIRLLRKVQAESMNQKELSDLAKVDTATLSRIESGEIKKPSEDILNKIAKAFHLTLSELYNFGVISKQTKAETLRVGFGHCIWAAPIIKAIMEDGGMSNVLLTSYGKREEESNIFKPFEYPSKEFIDTGKIHRGPIYLKINEHANHNSSKFISWDNDPETLKTLKVYTADELIRLMKTDDLDCIIVPGEIYENHQLELIRAASITYTSKGGCQLCILGKEDIIGKLREMSRDPDTFWKYLNHISTADNPIQVVYARRTIAEKYYRTYITPTIEHISPEAIDLGNWAEMDSFFSNQIVTSKLLLFICWEPHLSWVIKLASEYESEGVIAMDFDFFELNAKENIPFVSFDILFRKSNYRKWKDQEENKKLLESFFSTIDSLVTQLSRGKEKYDKYPDAEVIAQYLNMTKDRCAEALLKLNFRFTYYPEWVASQ